MADKRDEFWKVQPSDTGAWMISLEVDGSPLDEPGVTYIGDFMTEEIANYLASLHNRALRSHISMCGEDYRDCRENETNNS